MTASRLTILLSGMIAADSYQGGATWAVLQYMLGFRRLGHAVYFVEPVAEAALQSAGTPLAPSVNAAYFRQVMSDFGFEQTSALLLAGTQHTVGLSYPQLREVAGEADILINISGMLTDEALINRIPVRVYLDLDPAFNQLWQAVEGIDMRFAGHTHFVTIGLAIGQPDCRVPTCGLEWITTLQPVVLAHWPVATRVEYQALTTIANWRGYGSIRHEGIFYGQKAHSLRPLMALPTLTAEQFMLALAIHPEEVQDLAALHRNGWCLLNPAQVARTPERYRHFIQGSRLNLASPRAAMWLLAAAGLAIGASATWHRAGQCSPRTPVSAASCQRARACLPLRPRMISSPGSKRSSAITPARPRRRVHLPRSILTLIRY